MNNELRSIYLQNFIIQHSLLDIQPLKSPLRGMGGVTTPELFPLICHKILKEIHRYGEDNC